MHPFYLEQIRPRLQHAHRQLGEWRTQLRPYLYVCRLHRPVDLILLLLPLLWVAALRPGAIDYGALFVLIVATSAMRCAAWVYNDLLDTSMLPEAPESFITLKLATRHQGWLLLFGLLLFAALLLLFFDSSAFIWGAIALLLLLSYPFIKQKTLLTQPYIGLCFAWVVTLAQLLTPDIAAKTLWLLFTATLLWATANTLLYTLPRRDYEQRVGIGSLVYLFGNSSRVLILSLQLFSVIALWFVASQATLGGYFSIALLLTLALIPYQQWLLARDPEHGAVRAYRSNILLGSVILMGLIAERL